MSKLNYIGSTSYTTKYSFCSSFEEFLIWFSEQQILGLDVETTTHKSILERELRSVQFTDQFENITWVIQWSSLSSDQKSKLLNLLQTTSALLITVTTFEYVLFRKYGVRLRNIWDAFAVEKLLYAGKTSEKGFFSLAGIYKRRFDIDMSKALQLSFDDDIFTDEKIAYAALDTLKLAEIRRLQIEEAKAHDKSVGFKSRKGLIKTIWWENEFSKVLGDIEFDGIQFDQNIWRKNYDLALPVLQQKERELNNIVLNNFSLQSLIENNFYVPEDRFDRIWTSSAKKKLVLSWIFPDIKETSKEGLKKYLQAHDPDFPEGLKITGKTWESSEYYNNLDILSDFSILKLIIKNGTKEDFSPLLDTLIENNFRDKLIENNLLIPKDTVTINWNSSDQKLTIFKWINASIESTNKETVTANLLMHELFPKYQEYSDIINLVTTFGIKFLEHVDSDGRIRTSFNSVLATGRLSTRAPSLLNIPKMQIYRDAFIATPGYNFVGADYSAEELVIIALMSGETTWLDALKQGYDIHSSNSVLIFKDKWTKAAEEDCDFVKSKQKCKCKLHKEYRDKEKTIAFGLSYGLTAFGAAPKLNCSKTEAQVLIDEFFKAFPHIKIRLEEFADYGVKHGLILEPVLGRPRFYDDWKMAIIGKLSYKQMNEYVKMSYSEQKEAEQQKSSIMKESMNHPIQGAGASLLKISGVLLRRFILNNSYQEKIRLLLPIHDEWATESIKELSVMWAKKLKYYMELTGKLGLKSDLLKAQPYIDSKWTKD